MAEIGRLQSFGLGIESTSGTEGTLDIYIPLTKGTLTPMVTRVNDESGIGIIDKTSDVLITQKGSEFSAEGDVRAKSFGYLLLLALGTASSPTTEESGVYIHTFTRLNSNTHQSASIFYQNGVQAEKSLYNMVENLDIKATTGEKVNFSVNAKGKAIANASGLTPSFATDDEVFLVSNMCVKFADDVTGLSSATPVQVDELSLNITKELLQKFKSKANCSVEALEFANQFNQSFSYSGEITLDYSSVAYRDYYTTGTRKAVGIYITGRNLIGATLTNKLEIILPLVEIENFTRSDSLDEIQTQTLGLVGIYDKSTATTISANLTNNKSTIYA